MNDTPINEATVRYLTEGISSDVVQLLMSEMDYTLPQALQTFYNSETYEKLEDYETGLYIESSRYVFALLQDELKYGRLVN